MERLKERILAFEDALQKGKIRDTGLPADLQIVQTYNALLEEAKQEKAKGLPSNLSVELDETSYAAVMVNTSVLRAALTGTDLSYEDIVVKLNDAEKKNEKE